MEIKRRGSVPTRRVPASYFTGTVWQDPIIEAPEPARLRAVVVMFEPGARTAWHTHPLGQTLYVTAGTGRFQTFGEPVQTIGAGDVIWIPPGEKHWHGAGTETMMTHIAMQEAKDGVAVDWLEHVSDEEYAAA
ncbi:cupin domain-containing protein [Aurantimonas sp. C2-6-R+9]|uniref:(R)-mandelonitrile lyase n=1 Tax=unclassified Aurantimonas TaxID=2638230 RepID=UPI002E196223|nr:MULTISPECIES: cupin domain-containing protein [unclassified Aurantimonas]MEC5292099.1 cupin domain-containing protein [Aurantimonas sp. C2-3-R2]MEC5382220.1 cupin domain-containing protein [Aurantimonas sp. C2-6-R+9]MEC5413185.1 cupin domain-containing protein [Aurantimonas sp. C2-4-R8]